jgi:hypothetical protein
VFTLPCYGEINARIQKTVTQNIQPVEIQGSTKNLSCRGACQEHSALA